MRTKNVSVKRADWVQPKEWSGHIGFVRRMAKDGSWADVDWGTHRKRMPTWSLEPLHTIARNGWFITDMTRKAELEHGQMPRQEMPG